MEDSGLEFTGQVIGKLNSGTPRNGLVEAASGSVLGNPTRLSDKPHYVILASALSARTIHSFLMQPHQQAHSRIHRAAHASRPRSGYR